ncbi:MAG: type II toxin-antitoxin system RelE/ParE family toxin [Azospirillum sp.]|nr:type II toxin-antitoxin system RelE/ParE family toxin [Azospirillum sp.]
MNTFEKTDDYDDWLSALTDKKGKAQILTRINRAENGNFGDTEPVGDGVSEMRIHYGPGYRVYYTRVGTTVYLLLAGGDKSTQAADIKKAKELATKIGGVT